jgi:hypothetical protein
MGRGDWKVFEIAKNHGAAACPAASSVDSTTKVADAVNTDYAKRTHGVPTPHGTQDVRSEPVRHDSGAAHAAGSVKTNPPQVIRTDKDFTYVGFELQKRLKQTVGAGASRRAGD